MKKHHGVLKRAALEKLMYRRDSGKGGYYPSIQDIIQYHLTCKPPGNPKLTWERSTNRYPCWDDIDVEII